MRKSKAPGDRRFCLSCRVMLDSLAAPVMLVVPNFWMHEQQLEQFKKLFLPSADDNFLKMSFCTETQPGRRRRPQGWFVPPKLNPERGKQPLGWFVPCHTSAHLPNPTDELES